MKAVIVAAGRGTRLLSETGGMPKCLVPICDRPLIDYSLCALREQGIGPIGIVVGHRRKVVEQALGPEFTYIYNPFYATTNNMASSWFADSFVRGSAVVYLHADLLYHPDVLRVVLEDDAEIALSVHEAKCDKEAMKVVQAQGYLVRSSKDVSLSEASGEWVGIAKFSEAGWGKYVEAVEGLLSRQEFEAYDTRALTALAESGERIRVVLFRDYPFIEIDTPEDLAMARTQVVKEIL